MSSELDRFLDIDASFAAAAGSKLSATNLSLKRPVSSSTRRATIRSSKSALTSAPVMDGSPTPAIARMLRCLSNRAFSAWIGRSATAAPDTSTEHTRHTSNATSKVRAVDSFLLDMACQPPLDVGLDDKVIDQRRTQVGKQDCQHHSLRESRVYDSNQHYHDANQRTEDPFTQIGHRSGDRVSRHEDK